VLGIAANHGPTVQLVDLVREEWNDPTIIIVRSGVIHVIWASVVCIV